MKEIRQNPTTLIEILRHSRHEWLNHLQLVKGYLEMGDVSRVQEIIDEMAFLANQETRLSNLRMNQTSALLLTYNWNVHNYKVDYEVLVEREDFSLLDEKVYKWTETFLQLVDHSTDVFYENELSITIDGNKEECRFIFDFSGKLKEIMEIQRYLGQVHHGIEIHMHDCSLDVFSIEMRVKR